MQHGQMEQVVAIRREQHEAAQKLEILTKEINDNEIVMSEKHKEKQDLIWKIRYLRKRALQTMDYTTAEWERINRDSTSMTSRSTETTNQMSEKEEYQETAERPRMIENEQGGYRATARPRPSSCRPPTGPQPQDQRLLRDAEHEIAARLGGEP